MKGWILRAAAVTAMLAIVALPVAAVVCAHACSTPESVAGTAEHCHKDEPGAIQTIGATVHQGCASPFAWTDVAARDRASAPVVSAPQAPPPLHVRDLEPAAEPAFAFVPRPPLIGAGLSPGARLPLRI